MSDPISAELIEELQDYIRRQVFAGFADSDEIIESTLEVYEEEADENDLLPHIKRLTTKAFEAHEIAQKEWIGTTDCEHLDAAFEELESTGIVCRQDFSCCGNCGSAEIWEEMEYHDPPARGYTFYHMQDTDRAVDGGGIYLNFGATEEGEAAALAVAQEITNALSRHGLRVNWNGSWDKRIGVALDWKRRRSSVKN